MLWKDINQDHGTGSYTPLKLTEIFVESMDPTFHTQGDAFPNQKLGFITARREKVIHSIAAHGLVSLNAVANPFTGIFKGSTQGIIRMSSSAQPKLNSEQFPLGPGMGIKFLRDGVDSANTVTMYQGKGQYKEWNFFAHTQSNHVFPSGGDFKLKPVLYKSSFYTDYVYQTGTSDMAKFDAQGNKESNVVFPFRLEFEPNASVKSRFSNSQPADAMNYLNDLKSIPSGSVLYHMYGWTAPPQIGGKRVLIGDL
jgi:hypothetical protein